MLQSILFTIVLIIIITTSPVIYGQSVHDLEKKLETVKYVDLTKYTGTWYEVAKIPNRFQNNCDQNTTATYQIRSDGTISVINRCMDPDGEEDSAEGMARVVDTVSNAKLEVSFFSIFGWHLFWGDYWIIGLDEDYQYPVIGTPSRKYGWILSRQQTMSEVQMKQAFDILRNQGYNPDDFVTSKQTGSGDAGTGN